MRVKHLLKSAAHQHKDPQVRLAHVRELDPDGDEAAEVLATLANGDEDPAVRVAAIERLRDLAVLRGLLDANGDDATEVREAAEARLGVMIETGTVSDVAVRALLETHADRLAALVANRSPVPAQREVALAALDDETALLGVVQSSRLHDTRLAAASRLTRHDTMRAALTACRSRDKVVAKLLQQRLDAEAAAEAARIATRHGVTTTLGSMRALAASVWSPQTAGRAQALRERWAAFDTGDTEADADAFAEADARVQAMLDERNATAAGGTVDDGAREGAGAGTGAEAGGAEAGGPDASATSTPDPGDAGAPASTGAGDPGAGTAAAGEGKAVPEPDAASVALAARLQPLEIDALTNAVDDGAPAGTSARGDEPGEEASRDAAGGEADGPSPLAESLRAHARAVAVLFDPPFDHQRARPAAIRQRLGRVDALLDTDALLPGLELSTHRYVQALGEHRAILAERLGKSEQESADRVKATHRQFAALGGIIGEGKWAPANSLLRRLQKKLAAMEPAERAGLDDKLARAEQQLAEMGDWQDFAARPKLEALCADMEALPARELTPPKLAKEVRELQSQWKALGPSRAANELWPRFKTAGDAAYEPCKAYFAARGEERQAKVEARRAICEALEADVVMLGNARPRDAAPRAGEAKAGSAAGGAVPAPDTVADGAPDTAADEAADTAADGAADGTERSDAGGSEPASADVPDDAATADGGDTESVAAAATGEAVPGATAPTDAVRDEVVPAGEAQGETVPDAAAAATPGDGPDGPDGEDSAYAMAGEGPEPDWKAIQRRVGDAKREWSRNRITDRKPDRALEARFSAALKPFERALSTRYKANEAAKRALIEKAEALAGGEITQHVANQAKTLLSAWKQVGIMPRRVDQALWETFNGHLGTIFRHQQAVVREKRRAGLEHVDRARAIARELRALAKGPSVDEGAVQALADEFHALAEFPERDRRGLERDFRAALDATARVQETAGKRRRQAEQEERLRLVGLCERVEAAVESGDADATLAEDVRHAWEASETRVAREMGVRLEARRDAALAHLEAGTGFDLAANEELRRDLLIRMEVAADIETPSEDKGRRMRYQLENLQAGMTSAGVADRRATLAALEEDWLAAPPASRTVHDALHSRYLKALGR